MISETPEEKPSRRNWIGFWSMVVQQTQNAFNDKVAQFILIPLGGVVAAHYPVESLAGILIALPFVLFAPLAGWVSDRFSKRDVMFGSAIAQVAVLLCLCASLFFKNLPLALGGFFSLAVQAAFFSPAKFGITKELLGSRSLGFAVGIQQMTAMLALLAGQILAGWLFDVRYHALGGHPAVAWQAALTPLVILTAFSIPALALALIIPRVPAQGGEKLTARLAVSHFSNLADLWKDAPLRRASFGVGFFWGFASFINLWSVKLAKALTHGGEGFGTLSSEFMAAASLGMAAGFGAASYLQRKHIELGWVPLAGAAMSLCAFVIAFLTPGSWVFLLTLGTLAFSGAIFLAPINAWMQDAYPAAKRGELQAAVNLQDCFAGIIAVIAIEALSSIEHMLGLSAVAGFRVDIALVGLVCALMTWFIIRLLPQDFIRLVGVGVIRTLYRIQVFHAERIPAKGGALLLPNHVSFADAFFISAACPRPVRFVMDEAFMANPVIRWFVSIFDTVTIRRDQPREAIRITIDALKNGDLVCLFPEGQLTRTGTLCELRRGFELIAKKAGHPLIPMWVDGSWGSIASFERGRFFRKWPYQVPYGLAVSFGEEIPAAEAAILHVRDAMLRCSAEAIRHRFPSLVDGMANRLRANAHQLGQFNALQRKQVIHLLKGDPALELVRGYARAFGCPLEFHVEIPRDASGQWLGGSMLRTAMAEANFKEQVAFYDFSPQALEPLERENLLHCPCLALDGQVVAMTMEAPPLPLPDSEFQHGKKPRSWGKLLPGWYVETLGREHVLRGPAAPEDGLLLPAGCELDAEGFLCLGGGNESSPHP